MEQPRPTTVRTAGLVTLLLAGACNTDDEIGRRPARAPSRIPASPGGSAGVSAADAESFVRSFYRALRDGDVERARRMVLVPSDAARRASLPAEMAKFSRMLRDDAVEIEVRESRTNGPCALVVLSMHRTRDGKSQTLVREEFVLRHRGSWLVVPDTVRTDAKIRPFMDRYAKPLFLDYRARLPELRRKYG